MYGGPWDVIDDGAFVALLMAFLLVTLAAAWAAWLAWTGSWAGAAPGLALLPVEAVLVGLRAAVSVAVRCGPWHPFCPRVEIPEAASGQGSHPMIIRQLFSHPAPPHVLPGCVVLSGCNGISSQWAHIHESDELSGTRRPGLGARALVFNAYERAAQMSTV